MLSAQSLRGVLQNASNEGPEGYLCHSSEGRARGGLLISDVWVPLQMCAIEGFQ